MTMAERTQNNFQSPEPHDPIEQVFDNVFWVHGSINMGKGIRISRNMVIVREGSDLTLISPVRLDAEGEAALEALGTVKNIVRLGAFHGVDDAYYVDRYGASFWCQDGSDHYPEPKPDHILAEGSPLPFDGAELFVFRKTTKPESALLLPKRSLLITVDGLQHYANASQCSFLARLIMPFIGFPLRMLVGPFWLKGLTPEGGSLREDFDRLLELDFDNLISAHGTVCRGGAHDKVRTAIELAFK
jgi:hypothetical protein